MSSPGTWDIHDPPIALRLTDFGRFLTAALTTLAEGPVHRNVRGTATWTIRRSFHVVDLTSPPGKDRQSGTR